MAKKKKSIPQTRKRCEECGFRIRGNNHDQGQHHSGKNGSYQIKSRR